MKFTPGCAFTFVISCLLAQNGLGVYGRVSISSSSSKEVIDEDRKLEGEHGYDPYQAEPYHDPYATEPYHDPYATESYVDPYKPVYNPYPARPKGTSPPTPRPTPRPTPNPTNRPTPMPTPKPSPMPSFRPTPNPTPLPTFAPTFAPTRAPTDPPTKVPTPRPTVATSSPSNSPTTSPPSPQPSPAPSPGPSPGPSSSPTISAQPTPIAPSNPPSENPTQSEEPSENPTRSEEPSNNPTMSEEPSNNPTQSEEPSENPTQSEEPSEFPTQSEEPSFSPTGDLTVAEIICLPQNADRFGIFCFLIRNTGLDVLLNEGRPLGNRFSFGRSFDILDGLNRRRELSESDGKDSATDAATMDGEEEQEQEERVLQNENFNSIIREFNNDNNNVYTVFVPTNAAFRKIGFEVIEYLLLDIDSQFKFVRQIVEFHILPGRAIPFVNLICGRKYPMANGLNSRTECKNSGSSFRKFQVGNGNRDDGNDCRFNVPSRNNGLISIPGNNNGLITNNRRCLETYPEIIAPRNLLGSNGIVHTLDDVMIPFTPVFPSPPGPGPIDINTPSPTAFGNPPTNPPTRNDRCCPGQNPGDAQCMRTIAFIYTQQKCAAGSLSAAGNIAMPGYCRDLIADDKKQPSQMRFELYKCGTKLDDGANRLYRAGEIKVNQQFSFTQSNLEGSTSPCLPDCLQVRIISTADNDTTQIFNIDTNCADNIACGFPEPTGRNICPSRCPRSFGTCGKEGENGCPKGVDTEFCRTFGLKGGINGIGAPGFNTGSLQLDSFQCPGGEQGYPGGSLAKCGEPEGTGTCPNFCAKGGKGFCGY